MRSDLMVAQALGFNMIRKTAKIEPDRWYFLCDTMGLLVWQEIPAGNNQQASATTQFDLQLESLVRQLENHPSIVSWVLFQQGRGEHNPQYYADRMQQIAPNRLICVSSGGGEQNHGNIYDVFMLPEFQPMMYQSNMAQTIGRFGGIDLFAAGNSWSPEHWGYCEVLSTRELLTELDQVINTVTEYRDQFDVAVAVYHQLVDLEEETDGLVTYNRELMKVPHEETQKLFKKLEYPKNHAGEKK